MTANTRKPDFGHFGQVARFRPRPPQGSGSGNRLLLKALTRLSDRIKGLCFWSLTRRGMAFSKNPLFITQKLPALSSGLIPKFYG